MACTAWAAELTDRTGYQPADRRPIASRGLKWVRSVATWLAEREVSPNAISVASIGFALLAAAALVGTRWVDHSAERLLWLLAAIAVQLRLLANLFDGMVALASGRASAVGELFNEVPDRVSDSVILIALGFVEGSSPHLGYAATALALFVAYVRAVGASAGASQVFAGIMAKPQRMFLVTVLCLFGSLAPTSWREAVLAFGIGLPGVVLFAVCVGCVVTSVSRLAIIAGELRGER